MRVGDGDGDGGGGDGGVSLPELASWQGWHCDAGLFTALSAPTVRCGAGGACACDGDAGLVVLVGEAGVAHRVLIPADAVAVQVGEAAAILSAGRLRATPHCVTAGAAELAACACAGGGAACRLSRSRQMLVLFCQPAWATPMLPLSALSGGGDDAAQCERVRAAAAAGVPPALRAQLPSLASRWRPGAAYTAWAASCASAYYA